MGDRLGIPGAVDFCSLDLHARITHSIAHSYTPCIMLILPFFHTTYTPLFPHFPHPSFHSLLHSFHIKFYNHSLSLLMHALPSSLIFSHSILLSSHFSPQAYHSIHLTPHASTTNSTPYPYHTGHFLLIYPMTPGLKIPTNTTNISIYRFLALLSLKI